MNIITRQIVKKYVDERLVSETKHPELDLWIYNYTPKCQYDQKWDDVTMMCRGLIFDKNGNVVARPFKKFFNIEEKHDDIPSENFKVYEKYDGSLGILYFCDDSNVAGDDSNVAGDDIINNSNVVVDDVINNSNVVVATRGSFTSEQAIKGTKILREKYKDYVFDRRYTYLFEIIYPENKIVVDYHSTEDLILLAIIDTKTGMDIPMTSEHFKHFNVVRLYDGINDITQLREGDDNGANREGYVILFESGLRIKLKFSEYVRLHKIVTELTEKRIWEHLKNKESISELLEHVPDEFYKWVINMLKKYNTGYSRIENDVKSEFKTIKHIKDRKSYAKEALKSKYKTILFKMYDKNPYYDEHIWKMLEPKNR